MQRLIEIPKDSTVMVSSQILNFDKPDLVFIPIKKGVKLLINKNDDIFLGTPLFKMDKKVIKSPISGNIKGIGDFKTVSGITKTLVIENNYKEKYLKKPTIVNSIKNIKKEKLSNALKTEFGINLDNKRELILCSFDDEPYVVTESFYLFLYFEGYLELLDELSQIYNLNATICVKSSNSENINKLLECLGMYPNINLKIVPNLYLLSYENILLKYLNLNKEDTIIVKASTFYDIYNLLKRNRPISDKLITITGNGILNQSVVRVKIGTKARDVIASLIKLKDEPLEFILNGLMAGKSDNIDNLIVTKELNSIFIMKKASIKKEKKCINCGACIDICPVKINPLLLYNQDYYDKVKDKCLKCGLCSYICPSNINFNKYLNGGENE